MFFSCKKQSIDPLPSENTPVFTINGKLGDETIHYAAGDDGIVMNSGIETRNGVKYAFGEFSNGSMQFKLGAFASHVTIPNANQGAFAIGDTFYFGQKPTESLAYLSSTLLSNSSKINHIDWYVDNVLMNNEHVNLYEPGMYDVCGVFTFDNNQTETLCNRMLIGFENDVDFSVRHFLSENSELNLWLEGNKEGIDSVQWFIDDVYQWTGQTCTKVIGQERKVVSAHVYYHNGANLKRNILVDGTFNGHFIEDFSAFVSTSNNLKWDKAVGLEINRNGKGYSTFNVSNYKGSFILNNVEYYIHPVTNEPMMRITVTIDAQLKSQSTEEVIAADLKVIFGLPQIQ